MQLHASNLRLLQLQSLDPSGVISPTDVNRDQLSSTGRPAVEVVPPTSVLGISDLNGLSEIARNVDRLSEVRLFKTAVRYVNRCVSSNASRWIAVINFTYFKEFACKSDDRLL